ncbi:MAG: hypothetical protein WC506_06895 [Candidatus Micrarchaeia archaeon]
MLFSVPFAQYSGSSGGLGNALGRLCSDLMGILPIVAMLGIVAGGLIYGAGQLMGAETRARANVWATALLTGSVISILIVAVAPSVISTLYGSAVTCSGSGGGGTGGSCGGSTCSSGTRCCDCAPYGCSNWKVCVPNAIACSDFCYNAGC